MAVRYGIMGPGVIAQRFAYALSIEETGELYGVASRDPARAKAFAQEYRAQKVYQNYQEMLDDENIDVVYIATTHNFHKEQIAMCLHKGKRVLCEKPMVLHKADAEELVALAKAKNTLLMEGMWTRCLPAFRKAKQWVAEGTIGEVRYITAPFCISRPYDPGHRLFNPDLAGGSLYDTGVYPIEFAMGILGEMPNRVTGAAHFAPSGVDDFVSMSFTFPGGAVAALQCGTNCELPPNAYIHGTKGVIAVYDFLRAHSCERFDLSGHSQEVHLTEFDDGFIFQIRHVAELVAQGAIESPLIPWQDTIGCAEIFDTLMAQWQK